MTGFSRRPVPSTAATIASGSLRIIKVAAEARVISNNPSIPVRSRTGRSKLEKSLSRSANSARLTRRRTKLPFSIVVPWAASSGLARSNFTATLRRLRSLPCVSSAPPCFPSHCHLYVNARITRAEPRNTKPGRPSSCRDYGMSHKGSFAQHASRAESQPTFLGLLFPHLSDLPTYQPGGTPSPDCPGVLIRRDRR